MLASPNNLRSRVIGLLRSPYLWAVVARIGVFAALSPIEFRGDAGDYHILAVNLAQGHGFSRCQLPPFPPTSQRPPLFSLLLALLYILGAGPFWASFALNLGFDLLSIRLAGTWARECQFSPRWSRGAQWVVAFCPLLLGYVSYSTTENLSVMLFLAATLFTFRLGRNTRLNVRAALAGGLFWGLLSLCRSYFLLFPFFLLALPSSIRWKRRSMALLVAFSLAAPAVWVARNTLTFGKPAFSQSAGVGWQAYVGLCFTNFDWWDMNDAQAMFNHPVIPKIMGSHCVPEAGLMEYDRQMREEVLQECVLEHPGNAAFNVLAKGVMLFINWGQTLPYTAVPGWIRWSINGILAFWWWSVAIYFLRRWSRGSAQAPSQVSGADPAALRFASQGLLYVVLVTLPFGIDARYLLAPFLVAVAAILEEAGGLAPIIRSGLFWSSKTSSNESRTP